MALVDPNLSPLDLKLISILVVTVGCLASGLVPIYLGLGTRHSNSLVMSGFLCFGGGVLLATSVVHILPDVEKDLPQWSQLIFCLGFLLIYLLDVIVQIISVRSMGRPPTPLLVDPHPTSYGAISQNDDRQSISSSSDSSVVPPAVTWVPSKCSNFSLLLAFSIHSLLEGLVIGVAKTSHTVLVLLLAVCSHKIIVAFCLGAELSADGRGLTTVLPPLCIFVFGSDVGIGIGALIQPDSINAVSSAVPVLQGLAGGTLLYVVVSEILPRERKRFATPVASIVQFISVSIGFAVMVVLTLLSP